MPDLATLILQCSIAVHPQTVHAIIQHESRGSLYALNTQVRSYYPSDRAVASRLLAQALREGRSTDIGLMQVNSQWLRRFGVTGEALFDPCTNIRIGTTILSQNYASTWAKYRAEKPALLAALSLYNTGNERRGLSNGYVAKVAGVAGVTVRFNGVASTNTKAPISLVPAANPRMAPTGFSGTGPKAKEASPR